MAKATIITATGTHITVDGTAEEIKEIISGVKDKEDRRQYKQENPTSIKPTGSALTDLVLSLSEQGFFSKPKSLLEIKEALQEQGHIYPITSISGPLIRLVRKKSLGRIKEDKKWKYVKRG